MAASLRELAEGGAAQFYSGRVGQAVVAAVQAAGGVLSAEDLAGHRSELVEPISTACAPPQSHHSGRRHPSSVAKQIALTSLAGIILRAEPSKIAVSSPTCSLFPPARCSQLCQEP